MNSKAMRQVCMGSHHAHVSVFFSAQYYTSVPKLWRDVTASSGFTFILDQGDNLDNIKQMRSRLLSPLGSLDAVKDALLGIRGSYTALVRVPPKIKIPTTVTMWQLPTREQWIEGFIQPVSATPPSPLYSPPTPAATARACPSVAYVVHTCAAVGGRAAAFVDPAVQFSGRSDHHREPRAGGAGVAGAACGAQSRSCARQFGCTGSASTAARFSYVGPRARRPKGAR